VSDWSNEETDDPYYADVRNFYKVERWTKDRLHILLCAGNNLHKARDIFAKRGSRLPTCLIVNPLNFPGWGYTREGPAFDL
jgi:hypothetical protein